MQGRKSRGTYRTGRAAAKPDWLTAAGEEVWMDDIARAAQMKLVSEADTTMFGNYCNLQGYIIMAWRKLASGDPEAVAPPIVAINQVTKMQEFFGIAGVKSRFLKMDKGGPSGNPFDKFKRAS